MDTEISIRAIVVLLETIVRLKRDDWIQLKIVQIFCNYTKRITTSHRGVYVPTFF